MAPSKFFCGNYVSSLDRLLNCNFFAESLQRIFSFKFLQLNWRELVEKFVNAEVAATDSDLYFVLFYADVDTLRPKLIDALAVSHKHHLKFITIRVVVNELGHLLVDRVILERNVDRYSCLKVDDVIL